jgi:hypothetical protein
MALLARICYPEGYIIIKREMIPRVFFGIPKGSLNFCVFGAGVDFETGCLMLCHYITTNG